MKWDDKEPRAYFLGSLTGHPYDKNGENINRFKLMELGREHEKEIQFKFILYQDEIERFEKLKEMPPFD